MLPTLDSILFGSLFVLCSTLLWYYRKYVVQFRDFPSVRLEWYMLYELLTGKLSKHNALANFFLKDCTEICKRYSKEGLAVVWAIFPMLLVFNPEHATIFLNASNDRPASFSVVAEAIGEGVASFSGLKWKQRKKLLIPAFRPDLLKGKMPSLNSVARRFAKKLSEVANGNVVVLRNLVRHTTFCVLIETFFGIKTDTERVFRIYSEVEQSLISLEVYTASRVFRPWLQGKYRQLLFKEGRKQRKMFQIVNDNAKEFLKECRTAASSLESSESDRSLISILLDMHLKDPSFKDDDIVEEFKTFISAGYDAVGNAMMWCLFTLASHSEIQERAFEEVQSVLGNDDADITHEDLNQLIYLECVIKETLRLYPVVPAFMRKTSKEVECGKYKIPKGTDVIFMPILQQRDPSFYPDPETFDPERFFLKSNNHPAFIAFAEGTRACMGKQFAMMELKVLLAYALRNFRMAVVDRIEDFELECDIALNPTTPLRFKLYRRK